MARRFQQQRRGNDLHLLFFLLFVLLILFLTQNGVNAQDSFSNTTCRDIGGGIGHVCLIFEVQGCTSPDLVLHVNRSGSEIYKAVVENGTTYTQTFTPCTATIHIANTPWQLTPTYSHFSYSGAVDCVLFRWTLDPTEVVIGEDCHTHTDCQSCLQSQRCGWCQAGAAGGYVSNQACFAENKAETQPFCGTCSQWYFNDAGTCPGAPPPPHSSSSSSSSTGAAQSSSSTGESGGGTTDDVQSSPALSTGGAVALGFVIGGVILGVGAGFAYYRWRKLHGGRIRVKTDDVSGVELRDGQEPLNDQKSQSDTYEAPRERGNGRNNLPADF